jgi:hypothetical protein
MAIDSEGKSRYEYTTLLWRGCISEVGMKTLLLTMALVGIMLPLAGCETMADTQAENRVRLRHAMNLNERQLNNDVEYLLYVERPVWLSRYPVPND